MPTNQVRSLPQREPVPAFENKYRPFAPTPPPYTPGTTAVPRPYTPVTTAVPRPYTPVTTAVPRPYTPVVTTVVPRSVVQEIHEFATEPPLQGPKL